MSFVEMVLSDSDVRTPQVAVAIPWGHAGEEPVTTPGIQWSLRRTQPDTGGPHSRRYQSYCCPGTPKLEN